MPFIPPDPGRLRALLDTLTKSMDELAQMFAESDDRALALLIGATRDLVASIAKHLKSTAKS